MKTDDFERELQHQRLRAVPGAWRAEILGAAWRAGGQRPSTQASALAVWWRELLRPLRWHLAGLGAAWLVVGLLNLDQPHAAAPALAKKNDPSPRQFLAALRANRLQVLELMESASAEPAAARPALVPPRRSGLKPSTEMA